MADVNKFRLIFIYKHKIGKVSRLILGSICCISFSIQFSNIVDTISWTPCIPDFIVQVVSSQQEMICIFFFL